MLALSDKKVQEGTKVVTGVGGNFQKVHFRCILIPQRYLYQIRTACMPFICVSIMGVDEVIK